MLSVPTITSSPMTASGRGAGSGRGAPSRTVRTKSHPLSTRLPPGTSPIPTRRKISALVAGAGGGSGSALASQPKATTGKLNTISTRSASCMTRVYAALEEAELLLFGRHEHQLEVDLGL